MSTTDPDRAPVSTRLGGSPLLTFFIREVAQVVTGHGSWWRRTLMIAGVAVLVVVAGSTAWNLRWSQTAGSVAFLTLMTVNAYYAFALTNSSFATAISGERERGTLDLLRITALSPLALMVGKGTSQFVRAALLLVAQIPLGAFCLILGGIAPAQMVASFFLLLSVLFFSCHAGLFCSVLCKTSRQASHNTLALILLVYFLPATFQFYDSIYPGRLPGSLLAVVDWLAQLNPWRAFKTVIYGGVTPWPALIFHVGAGVFCLLLAAAFFERRCEERTDPEVVKSRADLRKLARRPPPSRVGSRPLAWKEFFFTGGGRRSLRLRWILYPAVAALIAWIGTLLGPAPKHDAAWIGWPFLIIGALGLVCEIPAAATQIFGAEVLNKTLGDIVILPVRTRRLVWEKILGHVPFLLPSLAVCSFGVITAGAGISDLAKISDDWMTLAYFLAQAVLVVVLTVYWSLSRPKSAFGAAAACVGVGNQFAHGFFSKFPDLAMERQMVVLGPLTIAILVWLVRRFPGKLHSVAAQ